MLLGCQPSPGHSCRSASHPLQRQPLEVVVEQGPGHVRGQDVRRILLAAYLVELEIALAQAFVDPESPDGEITHPMPLPRRIPTAATESACIRGMTKVLDSALDPKGLGAAMHETLELGLCGTEGDSLLCGAPVLDEVSAPH